MTPSEVTLGTMLAGRYELTEELGRGGMGVVYRAVDRRTGGMVAVKLLHPAVAADAAYVARLRREARITASLTSPRIVRVIDLDEEAGRVFLVMEYVAGETLAGRLGREGRQPVATALGIVIEIARALVAAHGAGIVHRDLKPGNVMLVEGQVKVLDFGIARSDGDAELTLAVAYLGTPAYSAPEQLTGHADARSDIYALGAIFYKLLSGRPPFEGTTPAAVLARQLREAPAALDAGVPAPVRALVQRCLAADPDDRYPSAEALSAALDDLRARDGDALSLPSPPSGAGTEATFSVHTAPVPATATPPHNLPAQVTSFVGREQEVAAVRQLLSREGVRLLTLTGPGGGGKTRLALRAAEICLDHFPDGVTFVALASITDPALVVPTIAEVLGIKESAGHPLAEDLRDHLREKRALLFLDNFEQVAAAGPAVAELLGTAPYLKMLITSREALHLYGEHEYPVPPLALPDLDSPAPVHRLAENEAVRLFVERAVAARHDFTLTDETAATVAAICHQLDGLPLAIELAAARSRLFPPHVLLARLTSRLQLLTGGPRNLPARQQTLRNTIAWSYELLDERERALFRRLGAFVGGCTPDAAAAVCGADDLNLDIFDGIGSLIDKSVLRREDGPEDTSRFSMLETIREFALDRLEESGEAAGVRRAHAEYYAAMAEDHGGRLNAADRAPWLDRLEAEHGNVRAALRWSVEGGDGGVVGLRVAAALGWFWYFRGHTTEARRWLEAVLHRDRPAEPAAARAKALYHAAGFAAQQGEFTLAERDVAESEELARRLGDPALLAYALLTRTFVTATQGQPPGGPLMEECAAMMRGLGDQWGLALALNNLGYAAAERGETATAQRALEESAALARTIGERSGLAMALTNLGMIAVEADDHEHAAALFAESVALLADEPDDRVIASCLLGVGIVAAARGELIQPTRLLAAADARLAAIDSVWEVGERRLFEREVAAARATLGEARFAAAWDEGRIMSLEEILAAVLVDLGQGALAGSS